MMPAKKSENTKKVMDVNSPGEAAPDATSRPVIVTHKPMIEDPMVARPNSEVPSAPALAGKGKTINPLSSSEPAAKATSTKTTKTAKKTTSSAAEDTPVDVADTATSTETAEQKDAPSETSEPDTTPDTATSAQPADEAPAKPESKLAATETPTSTPNTTEETTDSTVTEDKPDISTAAVEKKKAEAEAAAVAQQAKYEKMIADKTYFVPIDQTVSSSSGKIFKTLIVLLLVATVVGIVLLDAGLIEAPIELPFDLIQN